MNGQVKLGDRCKDLSILIADDVDLMLELLKSMLVSFKFKEIYEAVNGEKAVQAYQEYKPDLVMLDIKMPFKDGVQAMKEILEINPDAYVILVSGETSPKEIEAAVDQGAKDFFGKPYNKNKVAMILDEYLAGR